MQLVVENVIGELYLELATERAKFREVNSTLNYTAQMLESCKQELTSIKAMLDEELQAVDEEDVENS